jgi:hypothetical protein
MAANAAGKRRIVWHDFSTEMVGLLIPFFDPHRFVRLSPFLHLIFPYYDDNIYGYPIPIIGR